MSSKKALIAELLEFGIWFKYHKYYDLYQLGNETDKRKKGLYVADLIRKFKNKEKKVTGIKPEIVKRKRPIPKEFSRRDLVAGMQRTAATIDENGNVISERYSKLPEQTDFNPLKENWDPVFTTLDTRNDRQWIRFKKPVEGLSEKEKEEFLYKKKLLEESVVETHYSPPTPSKFRKWIIMGCIHVPFQNKWLLDGVFKLMSDEKFDGIILAGDVIDMVSLARQNVGKDSPYTLWEEYLEAAKLRKQIDQLMEDGSEKIWLNGNHEDRIYRFLEMSENKKLGSALIGIDKGVGLTENSWKYLANWKEDKVTINDCDIKHGQYLGKHPCVKHCDVSSRIGRDVMFFHSHRFGFYSNGIRKAWNLGMLGDIDSDGFKYVSSDSRQEWGNGFGVLIEDGGRNSVTPIECTKRNFWFYGKKY